jgi:hypothetical protein
MVCFRQIIKKQASEIKKMKYFQAPTCIKKIKDRYLQTNSTKWSYSSAGSEHLPYKQGVLGSNPSGTTKTTSNEVVFLFYTRFKSPQSTTAFTKSNFKWMISMATTGNNFIISSIAIAIYTVNDTRKMVIFKFQFGKI